MVGSSIKNASHSLIDYYDKLVLDGVLEKDTAQREIAFELDSLTRFFRQKNKNNALADFFKRGQKTPKGLYIWGDVGRGKTMLMDMFFTHLDVAKKRRVHFHEFMDELHHNITKIRRESAHDGGSMDPISEAVKPIIKDVSLLCFDEFHVSDITNAMLLGRLFEKFFEAGIVVVATSNVVPDQLYHNGLNRELFLPFIELLKQNCQVLHLDARSDYRLDRLTSQPVFHFGAQQKTGPEIDQHWELLSGGLAISDAKVHVLGRDILVPSSAMGSARFSYEDLCEQPLGSRDYLAISHAYHTLVIEGVPQFSRENSNGAKRFIQLIDTLYDRGVKLVASFEVGFDELSRDKNTAFEFRRTVSRLNEMASLEYLSGAIREV